MKDIIWIHKLLIELLFLYNHKLPTPLHCNNQGAIELLKNLWFHTRTKHIESRCALPFFHLTSSQQGSHSCQQSSTYWLTKWSQTSSWSHSDASSLSYSGHYSMLSDLMSHSHWGGVSGHSMFWVPLLLLCTICRSVSLTKYHPVCLSSVSLITCI